MAAKRFLRRSSFLKTKPVFAVAMEGARTEPLYFGALRPRRDAAIRLVLVKNANHKSRPSEVLARLRAWARENRIRKGDQAWIVIDRDNFPEDELDEVCQKAQAFGYQVAMSNPCFELWLWLHRKENRPFIDRHHCQRQLTEELPGFSKADYDPRSVITEGVMKAIERAEALDTDPRSPWPRAQATRVHRLVRNLLPHF